MDVLNFGHESTQEVPEEELEKVLKNPEKEEEPKEEVKEKPEEEVSEEVDTEEKPKDPRIQALDSERAKRKQLEKELRELKAKQEKEKTDKEDAERLSKEKESLKKELLDGDYFDDEVADKFVNTFGERLLKNQIETERKTAEESFDKKFSELTERYEDADVYKPEIKELVSKGLTIEQAYRAAMPEGRFEQMRKDMEIEIEQRLLNSDKKADDIDIGHSEVKGEQKRTQYTKREQEIAKQTGVDVKDVRKRMNAHTLEEMLELNKKE